LSRSRGGVDHIEVADGTAVLLEHEVPEAVGKTRLDIELKDARGFPAVDRSQS
jgi:hypothetical protein